MKLPTLIASLGLYVSLSEPLLTYYDCHLEGFAEDATMFLVTGQANFMGEGQRAEQRRRKGSGGVLFLDMNTRRSVKRLVFFVPAFPDHLIQSGGEASQHFRITRGLVIAGQCTHREGEQVGILSVATFSGALHNTMAMGQHDDPTTLRI